MNEPKSPGQLAYEQDCQRLPHYLDGSPRLTWTELTDMLRDQRSLIALANAYRPQ